MLRQKPILLDMDEDEQQHPLVLARFVQTFKVECWDTNQAEWTTEWDNTNAIPPLIRVKLVLGGNNNDNFGNAAPTLAVTRVIAVPSQTHAGGRPDGRRRAAAAAPPSPPSRRCHGQKMKIRLRPQSDGIALLIVMCAIFVLSILAAGLAFSMKVESTLAQSADTNQRLVWLGRSGVELARWVLAQEAAAATLRLPEPNLGRRIGQHGRNQQPAGRN